MPRTWLTWTPEEENSVRAAYTESLKLNRDWQPQQHFDAAQQVLPLERRKQNRVHYECQLPWNISARKAQTTLNGAVRQPRAPSPPSKPAEDPIATELTTLRNRLERQIADDTALRATLVKKIEKNSALLETIKTTMRDLAA